jgi:drug/metabolite transporter (DMT)-like permease
MATINTQNKTQYIVGAALVLFSAIAFSSKAVMVKLAYAYGVDVETLLALRMLFSAPFYLVMAVWLFWTGKVEHLTMRDYAAITILGAVGGYLPMWLDFAGLVYVSAGLERIILFVYPTMVVLISAMLLGRAIGRTEVVALVLSYVGVAVAAGGDVFSGGQVTSRTMLGAGLIFASALTYAGYLVASGKLIPKLGVLPFTVCIMLMTSLTASAHYAAMPHQVALTGLPVHVYGIGALMAVVATVLPSFLLSAGIHRIGSSQAALVATIGPVSTIYLAYLFLGEAVTATQMIGTICVMAGVFAITVMPAKK